MFPFRYSLRTLLRLSRSSIIPTIVLATVFLISAPSTLFADDGSLPTLGQPLVGNYCVVSDGVALHHIERDTLQLSIDGTPIAAYLFWSGRDNDDNNGLDHVDNALMVAIDGSEAIEISAAEQEIGYAGFNVRYNFSYRSEDLAALLPTNKAISVDVWDLDHGERHGVSLVVVYESPACVENTTTFHYGVDSFSRQRTGEAGPTSEIVCTEFPSVDIDRTLSFQMGVGGVAGTHRGNDLLFRTGTGTPPIDMIADAEAQRLTNHPHSEQFPLTGNGGEWDNYVNKIPVPAGATYACLQIDSVQRVVDGERIPGASGVWVDLVTQLTTPDEPPVQTNPVIRIVKTADAPQVDAGNPIGFRMTVTSDGDAPAEEVIVSDVLPAQTGLSWSIDASVSDTGCRLAAGKLTCQFGTLLPTESRTVHITSPTTVETAHGCPGKATIDNRATVSILTGQSDEDDASIDVACYGAPAIAIRKVADHSQVSAGEQIGFQMVVSSTGSISAHDVTLSDALPATDLFSWRIDLAQSDAGCAISENTLTCGFGTLQPEETRRVHIVAPTTTPEGDECDLRISVVDNDAVVTESTGLRAEDDASINIHTVCPPRISAGIGNFVWEDLDGNGLQGNGEPGIAGVLVSLHNEAGALLRQQQTGSDGSYLFADLDPGTYSLHFATPDGYVPTAADQDEDDTVDSDASPENGRTATTMLDEGEFDDSWDAGFYRPVSVGNYVWYDEFLPYGIQNSNENGASNIAVTLYDVRTNAPVKDASGVPLASATDAGGFYLFENLAPGSYYVAFELENLSTGFSPTNANAGDSDALDSDAEKYIGASTIRTDATGHLVSGQQYLNLDMGVRACPTAITLSGFQATTGTEGIALNWSTVTELNTWGYNIRRSVTPNLAEAELITPYVLVANGQDGQYRFVDESVEAESTPFYWLEEVGGDGAACSKELFGPFRVLNPTVKPSVYLPLVTR